MAGLLGEMVRYESTNVSIIENVKYFFLLFRCYKLNYEHARGYSGIEYVYFIIINV